LLLAAGICQKRAEMRADALCMKVIAVCGEGGTVSDGHGLLGGNGVVEGRRECRRSLWDT
jgi:hypothetical protein